MDAVKLAEADLVIETLKPLWMADAEICNPLLGALIAAQLLYAKGLWTREQLIACIHQNTLNVGSAEFYHGA
jgi:hypothetical protein